MRKQACSAAAVILVGLAVTNCEKTSTGPGSSATSGTSVTAVARFYNGATPPAGSSGVQSSVVRVAHLSAAANASQPAAQVTPSLCSAKCWFLSPDRITMTLTGIQPSYSSGGSGAVIAVNCPVTYDKTKPGLTQLVDCPFTLSAGTITGLMLTVSSTIQVLINDATAGFYSTSTGIVTSPPAGGAQPLSVTIGGTNANELQEPNAFPAPVQITAATPVTFSVIMNGLQSFKVAVTGSTVTLGWPGTSYTDPGRPDWAVAAGPLASVAFYASQTLGTTGSFCAGGCAGEPGGVQSVTVLYANATTPEMVIIPINGLPSSPSGGCGSFGLSWLVDPRSYLGLDSGGNIGWAIPTDALYSGYAVEMQMAQVSTIGASTTLYCKNITADPAPHGGSFASGAPGIAAASNSIGTFILLAH